MLMLKPEWATVRRRFGTRLKEREPLASHVSFRIGGPADMFVRVESRDELVETATAAHMLELPVFVLGNGSNILVADEGIRGLVIENHADLIRTQEHGSNLTIVTESGASLPGLASRLARQGWSGLEWSIGIPSTVGAAIVGNAGAHGGSIGDHLVRVELLDSDGGTDWRPKGDLEFGYRSSRLKGESSEEIVLRAEFELAHDEPANCIARINQYSEHRRRTQPTDPSVGSMFKNPPGDNAGRLIEAAGLKGTRVGRIVVSQVHANFFVNDGGGSAGDVVRLIAFVQERVKERFGVELELEIQLVGAWDKS